MKTKGWKNVYSFTLLQQIKTKSFIISTVIITLIVALIAATANILPVFLLDSEISKIESAMSGEGTLSVSKLYISNETGIDFSFNLSEIAPALKTEYISAEEAEAKAKELETSTEAAMLSRITIANDCFNISSCYAAESEAISESDCGAISSVLSNQLKAQYLTSFGVPEDSLSTIINGVNITTIRAGKQQTSIVQEVVNMIVPMISSLVLFMFIFAYSQLVAQSVAIEKSSKIMEYLLTSIKPLAVIIGKVLAICTVSLMQFLIIIAGGFLGFLVSMPFGIFTKINTLVAASAASGIGAEAQSVLTDIQGAFSSVNIGTIIVILITFILGFLLYALIAGLAGASISKMEDLSAAIQPMSFVGVLGFYLAYFPQIGGNTEPNIISTISHYLPISSPFCLPSAYMLGQVSTGEAVISLLILLASVVVLTLLVAKVYEHIVLHTGNRLKISDMLKIANESKGTK